MRAISFAPIASTLLMLSAACTAACGGADRHAVTASSSVPASTIAPAPPSMTAEATPEMVAVTEEHNHFHATPSTTIASAAPVPLVDLTTWRERWPVAARDLAEWSKTYPDAHARVRDWDTKGDRFETMVEWAIGHSYEDFNAFLLTRTGWAKNEEILSEVKYRPAMDAFLFLVRRSSDASLELVKHPNGFAWLESHPDAGAPSNDTRVADAPAPPAHKAGATTVAPANPASAPTAPPAGTDEPTPNRRARAASPPPKRSR